jgi:hypothetical protein
MKARLAFALFTITVAWAAPEANPQPAIPS